MYICYYCVNIVSTVYSEVVTKSESIDMLVKIKVCYIINSTNILLFNELIFNL